MNKKKDSNMCSKIIKASLIAGTLDIIAAFVQAYIFNNVTPSTVLRYIASGVFGNKAYVGGYKMLLAGLIFHFTIAFACTIIFFLLYPKLKFLHHKILLNSFLIAIVAWAITNLVVIPMSNINSTSKISLSNASIAILILVVCIGLPISIATKKFYKKNN